MSSSLPSSQPLGDQEFLALALLFLDGVAGESERQSLESELFTNRARRDQFIELCIQRGELSEMLAAESLQIEDDGRGGSSLRRGDLAALLNEEELDASPPSSAFGPTHLWLGGLGLGFALALLAWFGWATFSKNLRSGPRGFDPYLSPQYVATLTAADNPTWGDSEIATEVGARLESGRLQLTRGSAEVTFDSGVRVVIQGPTSLVLHSDKGGLLEYGRLVARVPERAKGFVIETVDTQIVDLGTEFGIDVSKSGVVDVHVLDGEVQVESAGLKAGEAGERKLLQVGEAARCTPRNSVGWEAIDFRPADFMRRLSFNARRYPASLVGYWNFDEQGGPLLDSVGQNDGWARGGAARTGGLVGSGAMNFENANGERVDLGAGGDSLRFTHGVTIEALVVSNWSGVWMDYDEIFRKEDNSQRILLCFQHDHNAQSTAYPAVPIGPCLSFGLNLDGRYFELDMPLDGQEGRPTVGEMTDGRMHHIAATYDAASGLKTIYVDGKPRMTVQQEGAIRSGGLSPAVIGNMETTTETFNGTIDEVAVYSTALPAAEIAEHWRRAQSGEAYFP